MRKYLSWKIYLAFPFKTKKNLKMKIDIQKLKNKKKN
jgi:hypothetical protein